MSGPRALTTCGQLEGAETSTPYGPVDRFLGIPYAEPPVGDLRFRSPVPAAKWDDIRAALAFGPAPAQIPAGPEDNLVPGMELDGLDEDCLTLNVWAPSSGEAPRPVLVWIHGGAFQSGGTAAPSYDLARLAAEQGAVAVSCNYRLGALGFIDLRSVGGEEAGAATNLGLRDQLLALQWVHDNAGAFGGDPRRVTVFGESAGAGSILHLLTSKDAGTLVARAIAQSPGVDMTPRPEQAALVTARLMAAAGARTVDDLRALPVDALLAAQAQAAAESMFDVGTLPFHPVVDEDVVLATPSVAFADGAAAGVDLLIGSNVDELRLFPDRRADRLDRAGLVGWVSQLLAARTDGSAPPGAAERIVDAYMGRAAGSERSKGSDVWTALQTDATMRLPAERIAASHSDRGCSTFTYQLAWQARNTERDMGAFHAIDLPFAFDSFHVGWADMLGAGEDAMDLGHRLRSAWAAFAATGDPSCDAIGQWPRYDTATRPTMTLDVRCEVVSDPLREVRALWDGLWSPAGRPAPVAR